MPQRPRRSIYDPSVASIDVLPIVDHHDPLNMQQPYVVDYADDEQRQSLDPQHMQRHNNEHLYDSSPVTLLSPQESNNGSRRRRIILFSTLTIGLLVVIVIAATTASKQGDSSVSSAQSRTQQFLPLPPANLTQVCSAESLEESAFHCELACEVAECCDFPAQLGLSCLDGNEDVCLEYHRSCVLLDTTNQDFVDDLTLPPAPNNLQQTCAPTSLMTTGGYNRCRDQCELAECCYRTDMPSCARHGQCTDYSPCLHLRASHHIADSIAFEIANQCSGELTTKEERYMCATACAPAIHCCYPSTIEQQSYCPSAQHEFCEQYEACQDTLDQAAAAAAPGLKATVKQPPTNFVFGSDTTGSASFGKTPSPTTLQSGLSSGNGVTNNESESPDTKSLTELCESPRTLKRCIRKCAAASCCYAGLNVESCSSRSGDEVDCKDFTVCNSLYPTR